MPTGLPGGIISTQPGTLGGPPLPIGPLPTTPVIFPPIIAAGAGALAGGLAAGLGFGLGEGAVGGLVSGGGDGGLCPTLFRQPQAAARPRAASVVIVPNPATGAPTFFGHLGKPVLFSGDLSACKRVERAAVRASRAVGRTSRRSGGARPRSARGRARPR